LIKDRIKKSYYIKFLIVAIFMFVIRLIFNLLSGVESNLFELSATSLVVALVIIWSFYKTQKRLENEK